MRSGGGLPASGPWVLDPIRLSRCPDAMPTLPDRDQFTWLRCPRTGLPLHREGEWLVAADDSHRYRLDESGIPVFAEEFNTPASQAQLLHFERVADRYLAGLQEPHTREYEAYLNRVLLDLIGERPLGLTGELCCGHAPGCALLRQRMTAGVAVDIALNMLHHAARRFPDDRDLLFVQGDATRLPLADDLLDTVVILGGIHHVPDRLGLFREIRRVLKPGGVCYFREPLNDLFLWRWLRAPIYRFSPQLDHTTERPLTSADTLPLLREAGLVTQQWRSAGVIGFCLFMNSDVLVFNRLFRYVPGIRTITRWVARLDDAITRRSPSAGLQVFGVAVKP